MCNIEPPKYFKIDDWIRVPEINTSGTRDKGVYIAPNGTTYYFKTSIKQNKRDYPFEFWSEIAASRLGLLLRLPVLQYHIASCDEKIGCISENLINMQTEELVEGVNLIIGFEPNFKDYCKNNHRFDKIEKALKSVGLIEYRRIAVEMVLFDCLIGNTDRHSENWALIRNKKGESMYADIMKLNIFKRYWRYWKLHRITKISIKEIHRLIAYSRHRFARFYDNGSSLGRELSEERLERMLDDENLFAKFFNNGKSDIIVADGKTTFLDTIDYLLKNYSLGCSHFIDKHLNKYSEELFRNMIDDMDKYYPVSGFEESRISNNRKAFIVKLVSARINYIYDKLKNHGIQI